MVDLLMPYRDKTDVPINPVMHTNPGNHMPIARLNSSMFCPLDTASPDTNSVKLLSISVRFVAFITLRKVCLSLGVFEQFLPVAMIYHFK